MLEPIAGLFAASVIAHHVRRPKLREMAANGRDLAPREFGQFARRQRAIAVEQHDKLVRHGVAEQPAEP